MSLCLACIPGCLRYVRDICLQQLAIAILLSYIFNCKHIVEISLCSNIAKVLRCHDIAVILDFSNVPVISLCNNVVKISAQRIC